MAKKKEEPLINGIEENPEDVFSKASVKIEVVVSEIAGRPLETEEEKAMFLELMNAFFSSDIVYENLKMFVQFYLEQQAVPKVLVPEKPKIILP